MVLRLLSSDRAPAGLAAVNTSDRGPAGDEPAGHRHLVGHAGERLAGDFLAQAADLVKYRARLDHGRPVFNFTLAFAHAGFQRDGGHAFLGEDPDVNLASALDHLAGHYAAGLDGLGTDPARLERLQTELTEGHVVAPGCITSYAAFLAFSELDPLGHQSHR